MGLLELLIVILVVAWIGGFAYGVGNLVHLLLLIILILVVVRLAQGRKLDG